MICAGMAAVMTGMQIWSYISKERWLGAWIDELVPQFRVLFRMDPELGNQLLVDEGIKTIGVEHGTITLVKKNVHVASWNSGWCSMPDSYKETPESKETERREIWGGLQTNEVIR